jgi:hypothetical protein
MCHEKSFAGKLVQHVAVGRCQSLVFFSARSERNEEP